MCCQHVFPCTHFGIFFIAWHLRVSPKKLTTSSTSRLIKVQEWNSPPSFQWKRSAPDVPARFKNSLSFLSPKTLFTQPIWHSLPFNYFSILFREIKHDLFLATTQRWADYFYLASEKSHFRFLPSKLNWSFKIPLLYLRGNPWRSL